MYESVKTSKSAADILKSIELNHNVIIVFNVELSSCTPNKFYL